MNYDVDVVVIGAGPGGTAVASGMRAKGKEVAIVEADLFGGTCPNRGCDPKKILMAGVETLHNVDAMHENGVDGQTTINWTDLMRNKRAYTVPFPENAEKWLAGSGITTLKGHAEFNAAGDVLVGDNLIHAKKVVIATGQHPRIPDMPGAELLDTSTEFLDYDEKPKTLTFIGGGYITFELATIANAAGAKVRILQRNDKFLEAFDAELVAKLVDHMKALGIDFITNTTATAVEQTGAGLRLTLTDGSTLDTERAVLGAGRVPNIQGMNLEAVGVETDKGGVKVNDHLQTANENIYAIGDVVSRVGRQPKLTPVSGFEARYVVRVLSGSDAPINYPKIPTIVFAATKLAEVGVSSATAADNDDYAVNDLDLSGWYNYNRIHDKQAHVKIVVDKKNRQIVGGSVLSSEADETINYLTMLINQHITQDEVTDTVFAYPSLGSDLQYFG